MEQTAPFQFRECFLHGIGVDGCLSGQIPDRRKPVAGLVESGNDIELNMFDDLGIYGKVGIQFPKKIKISFLY